jgi:hypothetical protein
MPHQATPSSDRTLIELLAKALLTVLERLTDPIPLFLLGISIIVLMAAAIGDEGLVIELRVFFAFLAILGVAAGIASQVISRSSRKFHVEGGEGMSADAQERFRILRGWLTHLTAIQFQDMVADLLSPKRQDDLNRPITKGSFLNDMHRWGKLDDVYEYLSREFPERFPEETDSEISS